MALRRAVFFLICLAYGLLFTATVWAATYTNGLRIDRAADDWTAPPTADSVKNPVPMSSASISDGQGLFTQNCVACHGADGAGDGPTASFLSPTPANLTTADFWKQSDGTIFWKITNGNSPMPSFAGSMTDTQRWDVINYLHHAFEPK